MKKIILSLALFTGFATFGQTGSWYIGGNAGFSLKNSKQDINSTKTLMYQFSPEIGTYLTDKIQLGLALTCIGIKYESEKSFQLGAAAYSRYFFGDLAFKPFIGLNAGYLYGVNDFSSYQRNTNTISSNISIGFSYSLTPRISVYGSFGTLGYTYEHIHNNNGVPDIVNHTVGLNAGTLGNRFTIGMFYTFNGGPKTE